LLSGRNALLLFPDTVDFALIWGSIRAELWRSEVQVTDVSIAELAPGGPPKDRIASAIGLPTTSEIRERPRNNRPLVVALHGLEPLKYEDRIEWLRLLGRRWEGLPESARLSSPQVTLVVLTKGSPILEQLPDTDVGLAVLFWWKVVSALELRLVCRILSEGDGDRRRRQWRESLLPSLVAGDVDLVAELWNDIFDEQGRLDRRLLECAEARGWTVDQLQDAGPEAWSRHEYGDIADVPPRRTRSAWARGIVHYTDEYGFEPSLAAVAALGRKEAIAHRLWRGQAELFLPWLDHLRHRICTALVRSYGSDWADQLTPDAPSDEREELKRDPFVVQWGYLKHVYETSRQLKTKERRRTLVRHCWHIRNVISHYQPVTFDTFTLLADMTLRTSEDAATIDE
jgi:hypothetical protein